MSDSLKTTVYPVRVVQLPGANFLIEFPDFPYCQVETRERELDKIIEIATDRLHREFAQYALDNKKLPKPSKNNPPFLILAEVKFIHGFKDSVQPVGTDEPGDKQDLTHLPPNDD